MQQRTAENWNFIRRQILDKKNTCQRRASQHKNNQYRTEESISWTQRSLNLALFLCSSKTLCTYSLFPPTNSWIQAKPSWIPESTNSVRKHRNRSRAPWGTKLHTNPIGLQRRGREKERSEQRKKIKGQPFLGHLLSIILSMILSSPS